MGFVGVPPFQIKIPDDLGHNQSNISDEQLNAIKTNIIAELKTKLKSSGA